MCIVFIYMILLWPHVQSVRIPFKDTTADVTYTDQREQRPRVVKRAVRNCDASFDNYCFNNGQCMFVVDLNANSCQCELGFHGSRCEQPQLVSKPMSEDQVALIIVCVTLLFIGLVGALYFFCKWYKRDKLPQQQKRWWYTGVHTV